MYISRYAVNKLGLVFLEAGRGLAPSKPVLSYTVSSVCGIIGTVSSGCVRIRFLEDDAICHFNIRPYRCLEPGLFCSGPAGKLWLDVTSMIVFGLGSVR